MMQRKVRDENSESFMLRHFFELNLKDRKLSKYSSYELLAQPLAELRILKKL